MRKKILFIGGGSGGHIMPLIPLMKELKDHELFFVGADQSLDKNIAEKFVPNLVSTSFIRTGKLRRYCDIENIIDVFRTLKAIGKAHTFLSEKKPEVLFMKGGYVGVPFILANFIFRHHIPVITHESDLTSGLANKIASRFAKKNIGNFTQPPYPLFFTTDKNPVNPYTTEKTKLLVISGSLGGSSVNTIIEQNLEKLLKYFHVTIITGKGKKIKTHHKNLEQHEFLPPEKLANYLHFCNAVVSRGGSNSLLEIIAAKKPSLIIPLPGEASRGDQYLNAKHFQDQNLCKILEQKDAQKSDLLQAINEVLEDKKLKDSLEKSKITLKAKEIAEMILKT